VTQKGFIKNKPLLHSALEDRYSRWFTKTVTSRQGCQTHCRNDDDGDACHFPTITSDALMTAIIIFGYGGIVYSFVSD
jgi:hypothetical protein